MTEIINLDSLGKNKNNLPNDLRQYLNHYLELDSKEKLDSLRLYEQSDLPTIFLEGLAYLDDPRLENVRVVVVPDNIWAKGARISEYHENHNLILVKAKYFNDPELEKAEGWYVHELGHATCFADIKGETLDERIKKYRRELEIQAFDLESLVGYPNTKVEELAFDKQFSYLKSQGVLREEIVEFLSPHYDEEDFQFLDKILNKVFD